MHNKHYINCLYSIGFTKTHKDYSDYHRNTKLSNGIKYKIDGWEPIGEKYAGEDFCFIFRGCMEFKFDYDIGNCFTYDFSIATESRIDMFQVEFNSRHFEINCRDISIEDCHILTLNLPNLNHEVTVNFMRI